jgi:CheY-like chemotaxis protein
VRIPSSQWLPLHALAGIRVVLVDDEPDALEFLALVLASEGAEVAPFGDPVAALDDLTTHPADVVLSDLYMPEMSGWELLERVRAKGITAPAVAITAHPSAENRIRCLAVGFGVCVGKPFPPADIVGVVRDLAGRR